MFEVTPRFFKHYQVVKCATKLLSHLLETCLSTRNTLVKREKRSVTFPDDFFYRYKDKTSLTFPAEKEEDGNSYKNQEQDTTNNSTYYRTGI